MTQASKDSLWNENNPQDVAVERTQYYLTTDADGDWVFTTDRRQAEAYLVEDADGDWVFDTTVDTGGYIVKIGGLASFQV